MSREELLEYLEILKKRLQNGVQKTQVKEKLIEQLKRQLENVEQEHAKDVELADKKIKILEEEIGQL